MNSPALLRNPFTLSLPSAPTASQASKLDMLRCHALSPSHSSHLLHTLISHHQHSINRSRKQTHCRRDLTIVKSGALPIRSAAIESLSTTLDAVDIEEKRETKISKRWNPKRNLAGIWREIQGANNWEGLLDPMNAILRKEIIRYGEFAQACYDAFDFDPFSKYCGSCKYHRRQLFQGVGMTDYGYEVTKYLYATSNINLPGVFQKSPGEISRRDIVIAWRGTVTNLEWIADLMDYLRPAELNNVHRHPDVKVEAGFLNLYTAREHDCRFCKSSARDQVLSELRRLLQKYRGEKLSITITGHSLGSALAMLSAYDIAELGLNRSGSDDKAEPIPITVFSFAGPRVGNAAFKDRCEELGLKFLRVVNVHDNVPKVPGILFNEKFQMMKQ